MKEAKKSMQAKGIKAADIKKFLPTRNSPPILDLGLPIELNSIYLFDEGGDHTPLAIQLQSLRRFSTNKFSRASICF